MGSRRKSTRMRNVTKLRERLSATYLQVYLKPLLVKTSVCVAHPLFDWVFLIWSVYLKPTCLQGTSIPSGSGCVASCNAAFRGNAVCCILCILNRRMSRRPELLVFVCGNIKYWYSTIYVQVVANKPGSCEW